MARSFEEIQDAIQSGEITPDNLTDEEADVLEANLTLSLTELHEAVEMIFGGVPEELTEAGFDSAGVWAKLTEHLDESTETVTIRQVHDAVRAAFAEVDPILVLLYGLEAEAVWATLSETVAMGRVLRSLLAAIGQGNPEALGELISLMGSDEQ